jgi:hypothetical protein
MRTVCSCDKETMAMHWTTCPFCGEEIQTGADTEGKMIDCPACNEAVRVCPGLLRWSHRDGQHRSGHPERLLASRV